MISWSMLFLSHSNFSGFYVCSISWYCLPFLFVEYNMSKLCLETDDSENKSISWTLVEQVVSPDIG